MTIVTRESDTVRVSARPGPFASRGVIATLRGVGHMGDTDLITAFAAHQLVRGFSERTIERRNWSLGLLADAGPFAQHTPETIELFLSRWPAPQSRQSVRSDCHQLYKWAMRRQLLERDPTADVDPPKVPQRVATPLEPDDLRRAIRYAEGALLIAIMLGAFAGLRCGEISRLQHIDVRHAQGVLMVRNGKGGRGDVVPLAPELGDVIPPGGCGPVVHYHNRIAVSDAIRKHFRRLGIDNRPHDLRASFGTACAQRTNGNAVLVAKLMRHSSIATTQRYIRWAADGADVLPGLHDIA